MELMNIDDTPPPVDRDFLGVWVLDGNIEGIEWYAGFDNEGNGRGYAMNLNSNNMNEFGEKNKMFTHWCEMPILSA